REVNPISGERFARSAIRCCNVDTFSGSCAPGMFPSNESITWHPLPSPGSSREKFPCFSGTMECSDVLRPSRRASLPAVQVAQPRAQGSSTGPCYRFMASGDVQDLPGSWGILVCLRPALRPRQDRLDRPYDEVGAAPAVTKTRTPTTKISGLNHTALALAVYASSRPLLHEDARLASRCW